MPFASATLPPPLNLVVAALAGGAVLFVAIGHEGRQRLRATRWAPAAGGRCPRAASGAEAAPVPARPRADARARRVAGRSTRILAVAVAGVLVALGAVALNRPDGRVRITVLDVGQGDAILVDADRGARMLIDGGPDPDRLLVALDAHVPAWDRRIDLLVLTHPPRTTSPAWPCSSSDTGLTSRGTRDAGSRAGLPSVGRGARRRGPRRVAPRDRRRVHAGRRAVRRPVAGPGRGPGRAGRQRDGRSTTCRSSCSGSFGRERFLLAGDIEEDIDPILLARGLPTVDFLKVAHHGSRTSSTGAFLDAVRPKVAAVSAVPAIRTATRPGHDREAARAGAQVFRTDLDGTVDVTLDGTVASARAEGGRPQAERMATRARPPPTAAASRPRSARPPSLGPRRGPRPDRRARVHPGGPAAEPERRPHRGERPCRRPARGRPVPSSR